MNSLIHSPFVGVLRRLRSPTLLKNTQKYSTNTDAGDCGTPSIERTALYDFHEKNRGKMINFGGFLLPVQYAGQSIIESHLHTRQYASIFDVSHMLQTYVRGKSAIELMESICTADIRGSADGTSVLTVFTNTEGGILDDLIVTKVSENMLYVVSNAAMKHQDMDIMNTAMTAFKSSKKDVAIEYLNDCSLIAVQGPTAVSAVGKLLSSNVADLSHFHFMTSFTSEIAGVSNCRITRCGYTGEDGVEISIPSENAAYITETLLASDKAINMKLAGLGARDSLRLEAGLCLYGSDIDQNKTPIEAGLTWLVAKRRRSEMNFPGAAKICKQILSGTEKSRVGLFMTSPNSPSARHGAEIYFKDKIVGQITSGGPSPTLRKNIGMGYVEKDAKPIGTAVQLKIRDKFYSAEICKMPFVKSNYFLKPKK